MTEPLLDAPYHRLARIPRYRWRRPLVELSVVAVVAFVLILFTLLVGTAALPNPSKASAMDGAWGLILVALPLAMLTPAALLGARAVGRRRGALSSVLGRLRWRWLGKCAVVAAAVYALYVVVSLLFLDDPQPSHWPGLREFVPLALLIVLVIPFQALGEEYLCRGTLLQAVGAWISNPWPAIVISAAVFAALHGPGLEQFAAIVLSGAIMAWLTIRTGGLEAAIAIHAINNITGFLADAAAGHADRWITELNTELGWTDVVLGIAINVIYAALIARLAQGIPTRAPTTAALDAIASPAEPEART